MSSTELRRVLRVAAAELHDGVAQELFAASMDVEESACAAGVPAGVADQLGRIASNLHKSSLELRGLLTGMLEGNLPRQRMTVVDRIRACVEQTASRGDLTVDVRLEGAGPDPGPDGAELVVRTAREGIANVVKHAEASEALVTVRRGRAWWTILVEDDGTGEAAAIRATLSRSAGLKIGLASLTAEAQRLGGRLWLSSAGRLGGVGLSVSVPTAATPERL
ncbi:MULTISPECIES: sensor histidine kinase [Sciscionella]|uniref:sensor histidine kinase n=1 Tax=Sciscionella TaxID=596495 RepID=UPI00036DF412|nr:MULTISPECIES: histidine kinase [Sciscionella]